MTLAQLYPVEVGALIVFGVGLGWFLCSLHQRLYERKSYAQRRRFDSPARTAAPAGSGWPYCAIPEWESSSDCRLSDVARIQQTAERG